MFKRFFYSTCCLVVMSSSTLTYGNGNTSTSTILEHTLEAPQLSTNSYVIMDYHSGAILAYKNLDHHQSPASLTKMMTSYIIGQALKQGQIKNSDIVVVSKDAWGGRPELRGSSLMFLKVGQKVSVSDLNKGIVVDSGNDACIAMAEYIAGTQNTFVQKMNQTAELLKLNNTHFKTVHGLDSQGQYSTAHDMAILGRHLIKDLPEEYKLYSIKEFTFNGITQRNRNGLLWDKSLNVDGLKTGHTNEAGYNLVASAIGQNNMRLISVVMGAPSQKIREQDSKKLLQWGFANFETMRALEANKAIMNREIYYGDISKVNIGTLNEVFLTIPKGRSQNLKVSYQFNSKYLKAPLNKGDVVGKVIYQLDNKTVAVANLQVLQDVKQGNIFSRIWDWIVLKFKAVF